MPPARRHFPVGHKINFTGSYHLQGGNLQAHWYNFCGKKMTLSKELVNIFSI
jgi:hypothetical protein